MNDTSSEIGTGSGARSNQSLVYRFGPYEITVLLNERNEFIGISEVKVNKEFLSHKQRIKLKGYLDVSQFYDEDE